MSDCMWTIESALELIRTIEPQARERFHCFIGLCGGVVRNGSSDKDLDLMLIPMNGDETPHPRGLVLFLGELLKVEFKTVNSMHYNRQKITPLAFYGAALEDGRRIELIIQDFLP